MAHNHTITQSHTSHTSHNHTHHTITQSHNHTITHITHITHITQSHNHTHHTITQSHNHTITYLVCYTITELISKYCSLWKFLPLTAKKIACVHVSLEMHSIRKKVSDRRSREGLSYRQNATVTKEEVYSFNF